QRSIKILTMNILEEIRLLPIRDKAAILNELQEDEALNQYLQIHTLPQTALEELERRDIAYREGKEPTSTWESVKSRLQEIRNEL
ncbi:MAG: addiction module protein, partial [Chitinophagaceae bacterium]|nr:addiction module protein [Chitinophagaceae bacterium]